MPRPAQRLFDVASSYLPYDEYAFRWPPRPSSARRVLPEMLGHWEAKGWWAQIKKNGTGNVLFVNPERNVRAVRRENKEHKQWVPPPGIANAFAELPGNGWYVFTSELLHNKVAGLRNVNYIHDLIVADGWELTGSMFHERQAMLRRLFPNPARSIDGHYYVIDEYTWLAHNYTSGFEALFKSLTRPDDEGLVLKKPTAKLEMCLREDSNSAWQLKCRRETKNFKY